MSTQTATLSGKSNHQSHRTKEGRHVFSTASFLCPLFFCQSHPFPTRHLGEVGHQSSTPNMSEPIEKDTQDGLVID